MKTRTTTKKKSTRWNIEHKNDNLQVKKLIQRFINQHKGKSNLETYNDAVAKIYETINRCEKQTFIYDELLHYYTLVCLTNSTINDYSKKYGAKLC